MQQPARVGRSSNVAVQQLVGRWYIQERHNMDGAPLRRPALLCEHASRHLLALGPARPRCPVTRPDVVARSRVPRRAEFLQGLGFSSFQRSLLSKAGQETKISESSGGESIAIATSDLRGTSTLELPLSGDGDVDPRRAHSSGPDPCLPPSLVPAHSCHPPPPPRTHTAAAPPSA